MLTKSKKQKRIYLDHAATTYMDSRVKKTMDGFWVENFGNPSAVYEEGRNARKAISEARLKIATIIDGRPDEIIFTAGGTESDNLALLGVAHKYKNFGNHIIVSAIEHHAILHTAEQLQKEGFEISLVKVDKDGVIDLKLLKSLLRPETILVSVMYANNEIGSIQPISEIAKILRHFRKENGRKEAPLFHTDAIQAPNYLGLNVIKLGVDLMTLNGSKIYGPKGIGVLYIRRGLKIEPMIYGGGQEMGMRPGTENVPAMVGFVTALEIVQKDREKESARLIKLRDYFIEKILRKIPDAVLNGAPENRLPNNANFSFKGVEGEAIVLYLDSKGISCSTGSACSSDKLEASHVIRALGRSYEYAHGSVRFTMGRQTKKEGIDYVLKVLPEIIEKLRSVSALKI